MIISTHFTDEKTDTPGGEEIVLAATTGSICSALDMCWLTLTALGGRVPACFVTVEAFNQEEGKNKHSFS